MEIRMPLDVVDLDFRSSGHPANDGDYDLPLSAWPDFH